MGCVFNCVLLILITTSTISALSATQELKTGKYKDSLYTLAHFTINFDRPLYYLDTLPCSDLSAGEHALQKGLNITCEDHCDFASHENCGVSVTGDCDCENAEQICDKLSFSWTTLVDGWSGVIRQTPRVKRFRIFIGDFEGYYFRINTHYGSAVFDAGREFFPVDNSSFFDISYGSIYSGTDSLALKSGFSICPDDPSFRPGTYYIKAICLEHTECSYDLEVIKITPPENHIEDTCVDHTAVMDVTCISDSTPLYTLIYPGSNIYVYYLPESKECPSLISVELIARVGIFFAAEISTDLEKTNILYYTSYQGNKRVTLSIDCSVDRIYIHVWNLSADYGFTRYLRITATSNREKMSLIPIDSIPAWDTTLRLPLSFNLICADQLIKSCSFNRFIIEHEEICEPDFVFFQTPIDRNDLNFFWPPRRGTTFTVNSDVAYQQLGVVDNTKVTATFILREEIDGTTTSIDENIIGAITSQDCYFQPTNYAVYDDYERLANIPIGFSREKCSISSFEEANLNIATRLNNLENSDDRLSLAVNTMMAYMSYFHSSVQTCITQIKSITIFEQTDSIIELTRDCRSVTAEEQLLDPCCNVNLLLTECCMFHEHEVALFTYDYQASDDFSCENEACVGSYIKDFYSFDTDACGQLNIDSRDYLQEETSFWIGCVKEVFHVESLQNGIPCLTDNDCGDGFCDIFDHVCLIDTDFVTDSFISCLVTNLPRYILPGFTDEEKIEIIRNESLGDGCNPLYYDIMSTNHYTKAQHCLDQCIDVPHILFPHVEDVPENCRILGTCQFEIQWGLKNINEGQCLETKSCNIRGEPTENCNRPLDGFCGVCSGEFCLEVTNNGTLYTKSQCQSLTDLCVTPDGQITELSINDCLQSEKCYLDGHSSIEIDCSLSGICEAYFGLPFSESMTDTVCYVPSNPDVFLRCFFIGFQYPVRGGCASVDIPEIDCRNFGGILIHRSEVENLDEYSCNNFMRGCLYPQSQEPYIGSTFPLVVLDPDKYCTSCDLEETAIFRWVSSFRRIGSPVTAEWKTPTVIIPEWTEIIDLSKVGEFIETEILKDFRYFKQTELICRISQPAEIIRNILCSCNDECDITDTVNAGIGRVCQGVETEVYSSPHKIISDPTEIIEGFCQDVRFSTISSSDYLVSEKSALSGLFSFTDNEDQFFVSNGFGATIGHLKSDGLAILYDKSIGTFTLCMKEKVSLMNDAHIWDWDFCYASVTGNDLIPLYLDVVNTTSEGYYCGVISHNVQGRYYFLYSIEVENPIELRQRNLDSAATIIIVIATVIFFMVSVMGFFSVHIIFRFDLQRQGKTFAVSLLLCASLSRFIHLFLVIATQGINSLLFAIIAELPTYFLLSGTLMLATIFFFVISATEKKQQFESFAKFCKLFFFSTVPLLVVFITLQLVNVVIPEESSRLILCNGRVDLGENILRMSNVLLIVYRGLLALVSFITAAIVLYYGLTLSNRTMKSEKLTKDASGVRSSGMLIKLTLFTSGFVLLQGLYFIITQFIGANIIVSVLTLIVVECSPCIAVFYFLVLRYDGGDFTSDKSSKSRKGGRVMIKVDRSSSN